MLNPEFKRHIWLELTPTRLVLAPLVLGAIFFLVYLKNTEFLNFLSELRTVAMAIFSIVIFLWGGKLAAESVIGEVNDGTWEAQRMTAMAPWTMAWGKLLGSTAYAWYIGIYCAIVYCFAAIRLPDTLMYVKFLITVSLSVIMVHCLCISSTLFKIRKLRHREKIGSSSVVLLGVLLLMMLGPAVGLWSKGMAEHVRWFAATVRASDFVLWSVLFFTGWAVAGLYRNMRFELQETNGPFPWLAFLICLMGYLSGFVWGIDDIGFMERVMAALLICFGMGSFIVYLMVFVESREFVWMRRFMHRMRQRDWRAVGNLMPLWGTALLLTLVVWGALVFICLTAGGEPSRQIFQPPVLWLINVLLFLLRDLTLLFCVSLKENVRRAEMAAMFYLMILYLLIPLLLEAADATEMLSAFLPLFEPRFWSGTLPVAAQFAFLIWLMLKRWDAMNQRMDERMERWRKS